MVYTYNMYIHTYWACFIKAVATLQVYSSLPFVVAHVITISNAATSFGSDYASFGTSEMSLVVVLAAVGIVTCSCPSCFVLPIKGLFFHY